MYWAPNDTCRKEICSSFVYFRPQLIPNNMRKKTTVISSRACVSRKNGNDVTVTSKKKSRIDDRTHLQSSISVSTERIFEWISLSIMKQVRMPRIPDTYS